MAIKSIGRLAASLLLDTRQWTAGFAHAERTAKRSTEKIQAASAKAGLGTEIGRRASPALGAAGFGRAGQFASLAAAGPVGAGAAVLAGSVFAAHRVLRETMRISEEVVNRSRLADELGVSVEHMRRFELASELSGRNIKTIVQEFKSGRIGEDVERASRGAERFGQLSENQINGLAELNAKTKEFGDAWERMKDRFAAEIAPTLILALEGIMTAMERTADAFERFGEFIPILGSYKLLSLGMPEFADRMRGTPTTAATAAGGGAAGTNPALHFGSMEAVRAIQGMGANPLAAVAKNTADMLTELKPMADDIATIARRDDGLGLEPF